MQQLAILEAFAELLDLRQVSGKRHSQPLCLALFTVAVVAVNQGFFASAPSQKTAIVTLQSPTSAPRQNQPTVDH